jgi:hypothetical protein
MERNKLMDKIKNWVDKEVLTHTDLNAEFSNIVDDTDLSDAITKKHTANSDTALGAQSENLDMNTHKVVSLAVPANAGDAIRATASITEAALETGITNDATLTKATAVITDHRLVRGDGGSRNVQETSIVVDDSGQMVNASQPAFSAYVTSDQADITGDGTNFDIIGAIWTEVFDQNTDLLNGTFTAPVTGRYQLSGAAAVSGLLDAHTYLALSLITSNRIYIPIYNAAYACATGGILMAPFSFLVDMDAADTAYLRLNVNNGTKVVDVMGLNN